MRQSEHDDLPVTVSGDEKALYDSIRELVVSTRHSVVRCVNRLQVQMNYEIGRYIVEFEQKGEMRAGYRAQVLNTISIGLTSEFGSGFSRSNIAYMRQFFVMFPKQTAIVQTVSGQFELRDHIDGSISVMQHGQVSSSDLEPILEDRPFTLSWSHYVFLMGIKNADERRFYEIEAADQNWTLRELRRQYDSGLYERLALSRDKNGLRQLAKEGQLVSKPDDLLKEPLVLEFLGLAEQVRYSESDLESAIINHIEKFLLELGKGFLFESRQKRLTMEDEHFYVDLVFYNRLLRCYVIIDLKIGKLTHQDLGQMQMYVNYYDRNVITADENATIGIVLCKHKNQALVEITLPKDANIHAHEYQLYLPDKEELRRKLVEWGT